MAKDHCRRILVAIVLLAIHVCPMTQQPLSVNISDVTEISNSLLSSTKKKRRKKRGRSQRLYPRPNNSPCNSGTFALQGHAREREREGERERGRENAEKQSQAPKKSWKVVEGGEGGLTAERIVEQPLVVAAAFIAPLQPAPV